MPLRRDRPSLELAARAAAGLLRGEVERLRARGVPVGEDELRGLYISDHEADRILDAAGEPRLPGASVEAAAALIEATGPRMALLAGAFGLAEPEAATVALCLVAETDPEIERLVAYVQDDVSKKRPRVELLLRLFWDDPVAGQAALDLGAPLRRFRLIELAGESGQATTPLLARTATLDPRIARYVLGGDALDEVIAPACRLSREAVTAPPPIDPARLVPPVVSLHGADGERVKRAALALAGALSLEGLLEVELATSEGRTLELFERASREAALQGTGLLVRGLEALEPPARDAILAGLERSPSPLTVLHFAGEPSWYGPAVEIPRLTFQERLEEWQAALAPYRVEPGAVDALPALAAKFELDAGAIEAAARTADGLAVARDAAAPAIRAEDLYSAARARSAPILSSLARKVAEHKGWEDLILEPDPLAQLRELCGMVEFRHRVYDDWGFERKLSSGKGVVALFAGQSGTGKTMAAGVIAGELGLDLYKIDLSGVVSKYIGETEKNLGAIFRDASLSNAILFFDEADALFGKRSEVRDAHDRYANIETAYLLQQIEEYSGPVILSTNLKMNLDEAFLRRMHFVIDFPMPEEAYRRRIWQTTVPAEVPIGPDVDFAFLARQFRISGGNIRNIVLAAAFLAAQEGTEVCMRHFIRATRREFQKLGRMVTEADFGEHIAHLA